MILLKKVIMGDHECLSHYLFLFTVVFLLMFFVNVETKANDKCKCGIENKIACKGKKGSPGTNNNRFPWSIALKIHGEVECGGSLISNKHVLTAAHCIQEIKPGELKIALVDSSKLTPKNFADVLKFHIHPEYVQPEDDPAEMLQDIAIVELKEPVPCSNESRPVCLPSKEEQGNPNDDVYFAGWAPDPDRVYEGTYNGTVLREERFRIWPFKKCVVHLNDNVNHKIKQPGESAKKLICAAGVKEGSLSCKGDSGSTISHRSKGQHYAVGVNSFHSSNRCNPKKPTFFTKVMRYMKWINSILKKTPELM